MMELLLRFPCTPGNSAQLSLRTPTELDTLCFILILIHYTSLSGDVINTNTSVGAQPTVELEFQKIPGKNSCVTH